MKHLEDILAPGSYHRVMIKVSGESFSDGKGGIDFQALRGIADQIALLSFRREVAVTLGGGNFFRGASSGWEVDRCMADQLGMMATVMNGIALHAYFLEAGMPSGIYSSTRIEGVTEIFRDSEQDYHFSDNRIEIFVGGTGLPYFSTDTAAVLWALRTKCSVVLKGTQVDGVYDEDPCHNTKATLLPKITHDEVLRRGLRVMDSTALTLARENKLPLAVFNIHRPWGIEEVLKGIPPFTWIGSEGDDK